MLAESYATALACDLLDCSRSSTYYQSHVPEEKELKAAVEQVASDWPTYGSRRIAAQLRRQGRPINRNRVSRLLREMGLQVK